MSEASVIQKSIRPQTKDTLKEDFQKIGIQKGDIVLVHSSMSQIGWIAGREIAVIEALIETVGEEGTIVMPSFSGENSQPELWQNPPVPADWISVIKDYMPPFECDKTPTREMGKIAEAFWHYPQVLRSYHPEVSFSARGKMANMIVEKHPLSPGFGKDSPLQRLYDLNAHVLLLGVSYDHCTCMHLAEVWQECPQWYTNGAAIIENGKRVWKEFLEIAYDDSDFLDIGQAYESQYHIEVGTGSLAKSRYLEMKSLCDFAYEWIKVNRQ